MTEGDIRTTTTSQDLFYDSLIASYVDSSRFVTRDWLWQRVQTALDHRQCQFVLLTAEPGAGKSSFMAWVAHSHPNWPRYFIRRDQRTPLEDGGARGFLEKIGFQLAARFPKAFRTEALRVSVSQVVGTSGGEVTGAEVDRLIASPFYSKAIHIIQDVESNQGSVKGIRVREIVTDPNLISLLDLQQMALLVPAHALQKQGYNERIVILIDALDELRYRPLENTVLDWLTQCPELPAHVRIVVTSRPDREWLAAFRNTQQGRLVEETIPQIGNDIHRDLNEYAGKLVAIPDVKTFLAAHRRPEQPAQGVESQFVADAVEKAKGNLGYLDAVGRAIDQASASNDSALLDGLLKLQQLPDTLQNLHGHFLKLLRHSVGDTNVVVEDPVSHLQGLVNAWTNVYRPVLSVLAVTMEPLTPSQIRRLGRVLAGEDEVSAAIGRLRQFLDEQAGRYTFYHVTLPEFLMAEKTRQNLEYENLAVDPVKWHGNIVALYRDQASTWDQVDWHAVDDYGLRSLASHLYQLATTQAAAKDLAELICKPFVQEKQVRVLLVGDEDLLSPSSYLTVLGDADLALRRTLEHDAPLQVMRLALTHAFLRATAETRGLFGAVALTAGEGDYHRALRDAHLIGNPELRFLQLLLVVESMLDHDQFEDGLQVLDDALDLTVRSQVVSRAKVDDLGMRLIARHRAMELARKLAHKAGHNLDDWVAQAALAALEIDPIYATHLLSEIDETDRWYNTGLEMARRSATAQPAVARQVLVAIIARARVENKPNRVLDAIGVLRYIDEPTARQAVATVIDEARQTLKAGSPDQPREPAQTFNRAVVELAAFDLDQALAVALLECPDVTDSSWTRTCTLAHILERALDTGHHVSPSLLKAIGEPRNTVPVSQDMLDAIWSALARAFVGADMGEEGWALYDHITSPNRRVFTAIVLHKRYPRSDAVEQAIADLVRIDRYPSLDLAGAAVADLYALQPELARKALAAAGCSLSKVRVLVSVLRLRPGLDPELLQECHACIDMLPSGDQPEVTFAVAEAIAAQSPDISMALLERTLSILTTLDPKTRRDDILRDLASCAIKLGAMPLGNRAMDQWAKAAAERGQGREASLVELGSFAIANRMTLSPSTIGRLLDGIQNPYFVGRLLVALPGAAEEAKDRWSPSRALPGAVGETLASIAESYRSMEGIRRLLGYEHDPVNRAFLEGLLAGMVEDKPTAKGMLDRVWSDLQALSLELQASGLAGDEESVDSVRVNALVALARIDLASARARLEDLAPWYRHEVYRGLANLEEYRDEAAQSWLFREALASADDADDNPIDCLTATLNVARSHPGLPQEARQAATTQAFRHIARIPDDDRAAAYMRLVAQSELLTDAQFTQVWRDLGQDLDKVRWTLRVTEKLLSAARLVQDPAHATKLWKEIVHVVLARLQDEEYSWSPLRGFGPAILELAKLGALEDASTLLALDLEEIKGISYEPWPDDITLWPDDITLMNAAYVVCARGYIDPQGATELVTRFVRHLHNVAPKHASSTHSLLTDTHSLLTDVVGVLMEHHPDTNAAMVVWHDLVDLCLKLPGLGDRSQALLTLLDRALDAPDIGRALDVARQVPLQEARSTALSAIVQALVANEDEVRCDDPVAAWQATFAMASTNPHALSTCAAAWCQTYLAAENRAGRLVDAWQQVFEQIDLARAIASA